MTKKIVTLTTIVLALLPLAVANAAERPFAPRFSTNVNGQITSAANTLLQCPTDTVDAGLNTQCSSGPCWPQRPQQQLAGHADA